MKGRQQFGLNPRPTMKPDEVKKMREESMAILEVEFHNSPGSKRFWSKCGQRKHKNISEAITHLMWLVTEFPKWKGMVAKAAIFDARVKKYSCAENKIYQYENRKGWTLEQPIVW